MKQKYILNLPNKHNFQEDIWDFVESVTDQLDLLMIALKNFKTVVILLKMYFSFMYIS